MMGAEITFILLSPELSISPSSSYLLPRDSYPISIATQIFLKNVTNWHVCLVFLKKS